MSTLLHGLKAVTKTSITTSYPSWVRGLKHVDNTDIPSRGGVGDMGKRHPSDRERQQAAQLFTLLKERMPSWKLKRSVRWKGQEEGRILLIATPGDTFSPDPRQNEQFVRELKEVFTDYGLRLNILVPSSSHPHFDVDLEIVGLESVDCEKDHKVHKVTPTQFVAQTGCSYGFEIANKHLQLPHDTNLNQVVDEARKLVAKELDEVATLLVFDHFSNPETIIKSAHQIEEFVDGLLNKGFNGSVPEWLKMPLRPDEGRHPANPQGICFDTSFVGVRASSGSLMKLHHEVTIRGVIRLRNDTGKLVVKVGAKPSTPYETMREFSRDSGEKTRTVARVTSKEGLEALILELMEEVVFDVYRRAQGWSKPVIWKTS